ncbi:hypothetical protein Tsubulata_005815 [Turnera subulata]|uniref:DUF4283 domain-containing protein n=1 Tax=Turnera subulata TaxID=218843 RepID=A0A9Q0GH22_9ROSI|nr:hypothetical protein Tsubulata_005815 [Turnera subulata]
MQTISSLWSVKKGLQISELEKNLFMFRFRNARDKGKILAGEPWHFDRQVLVLKSIEGYELPSSIELHTTPFWVQIRDLPFDYRDPDIAEVIGRRLGSVMEMVRNEMEIQLLLPHIESRFAIQGLRFVVAFNARLDCVLDSAQKLPIARTA